MHCQAICISECALKLFNLPTRGQPGSARLRFLPPVGAVAQSTSTRGRRLCMLPPYWAGPINKYRDWGLAHTHTHSRTSHSHHAQSIKVYRTEAVRRWAEYPFKQHIFRHGNYTNASASTKSCYWHLKCQRGNLACLMHINPAILATPPQILLTGRRVSRQVSHKWINLMLCKFVKPQACTKPCATCALKMRFTTAAEQHEH